MVLGLGLLGGRDLGLGGCKVGKEGGRGEGRRDGGRDGERRKEGMNGATN